MRPFCGVVMNVFGDIDKFLVTADNMFMIIGLPSENDIVFPGITGYRRFIPPDNGSQVLFCGPKLLPALWAISDVSLLL